MENFSIKPGVHGPEDSGTPPSPEFVAYMNRKVDQTLWSTAIGGGMIVVVLELVARGLTYLLDWPPGTTSWGSWLAGATVSFVASSIVIKTWMAQNRMHVMGPEGWAEYGRSRTFSER